MLNRLTNLATGQLWQYACIGLGLLCAAEAAYIAVLKYRMNALRADVAEAAERAARNAEGKAIVEANRDRLASEIERLSDANARLAAESEAQADRASKTATRIVVKRVAPEPFDAGVTPAQVNLWTLERLQAYSSP